MPPVEPPTLHPDPLRTDDVMRDVHGRVREAMRARLRAAGATEFADETLFADVDAIFRHALSHDDRRALMVPALLADDWQPELSLRLTSHRTGVGAVIVFFKRKLLLPLTRWLFEYTLENFRRQQRVNLALMACLQTLAIEHVRLAREVAAQGDRAARNDATAGSIDAGAPVAGGAGSPTATAAVGPSPASVSVPASSSGLGSSRPSVP